MKAEDLFHVDPELRDVLLRTAFRKKAPTGEQSPHPWEIGPRHIGGFGSDMHDAELRPGRKRQLERVRKRNLTRLGEVRRMKHVMQGQSQPRHG